MRFSLRNGVYRFFATLLEPEFFNHQYIKLYVINEKEVNLFEVPKTPLKDVPKNWDIGLIVGKKTLKAFKIIIN